MKSLPDSSASIQALEPQECQALLERVASLVEAGQFAPAWDLLQEALKAYPHECDVVNACGFVHSRMGNHAEAARWYREALKINPNGVGAWNNLGSSYRELYLYGMALDCHMHALALLEEAPPAYLFHNIGLILAEMGCYGEAIDYFNRCLDTDPAYHMACWDRARSYLYLGNYRQGWADYEIRLITGQIPPRPLPGVKWNGTPYSGLKLLLLAEQGFGDTLWVLRYLPLIKSLGGEVYMECQPALCGLVESMGLVDLIIPQGQKLPHADLHCHLCSLPGLFSQSVPMVPPLPYLQKPKGRDEKFKAAVALGANKLKIGIVWSGSTSFPRNNDRALPLSRIAQILDLPGVQVYSLQKGEPEKEVYDWPSVRAPIIDMAPLLDDFADTAAFISNLDLIIMTDSAVAHLAGAMGKPVWLLLGTAPHWLWLTDGVGTPWYPSMRIFRQKDTGGWSSVLDEVGRHLMALLFKSAQ